ncbi:mercuric reductase [Pontibacter saemangeumensis]|uniref:Mercuric reductase n=1 Tax=Pontibacter saemangeumensis TaxID=1084525 RepID=A0ABP8M2Z6_9BACT
MKHNAPMPEQQQHFDAIIIGTGQGGRPLAKDLAAAGWRVAIAEETHIGGSCINYGCTPTKTLLASAQTAHTARRAADYGVHTAAVEVRMHEVKARRDAIVAQFREGAETGLHDDNITLLRGRASFKDRRTVRVTLQAGGKQTVTADKIFINTGTLPLLPPIDGLDKTDFLTYKTIQDLTAVPEHLLVLGGGYIGLEFGQMFRRFGSQVTIIQQGEQLLSREDEDVAGAMKAILEDEGINVLLHAETQHVKQLAPGKLELQVKLKNSDRQTLHGTHLLIATGVKANTAGLGLENAGVETDGKGNIKTSETLQTNIEGIYAMGDVKGGPRFTHISYDDYRILRDSLLHGTHRTTKDRLVPYCVFTDPQVGRVGMTEKQARKQGIACEVAKLPMDRVARGIETGNTKGFYKVLVHPESKLILGAAIIAAEGGEIMAMLQLAMMGKLKYTQLKEATFAHPTYAESLNTVFMALEK